MSNKLNKILLKYCTLIFSLSCRIEYVASYLSGNLQNANDHLAQIPGFWMGYLKSHLAHSDSAGSFFCIFHTLSIEFNLSVDWSFPLNSVRNIYQTTKIYSVPYH